MKLRLKFLCITMLIAFPLSARENTDVILMKNGDRITCEFKALRSNTLSSSSGNLLTGHPGGKVGPGDLEPICSAPASKQIEHTRNYSCPPRLVARP